jgi:hypothetical protein
MNEASENVINGFLDKLTQNNISEIFDHYRIVRNVVDKCIKVSKIKSIFKTILEWSEEHASDCNFIDTCTNTIKKKMAELEIDKWPHQTFIQAIFGSLFFPSSVDYGYASYSTRVNLVKIGCSARFKNPTAIELLSRTVSCSTAMPNGTKKVRHFKKDLKEEWKKYANPFTNKNALQVDLPHYRIARILYDLNCDEGIEWYTLGAQYDMRCKFMLARREGNIANKIEQLKIMWEKHKYLPALSELGRVLVVEGGKELGEEYLRQAREMKDPLAWKNSAVFVFNSTIRIVVTLTATITSN